MTESKRIIMNYENKLMSAGNQRKAFGEETKRKI